MHAFSIKMCEFKTFVSKARLGKVFLNKSGRERDGNFYVEK